MANPNPTPKFKAGNTLAATNGNSRGTRIRKSPLRKTENQLKAIEPQAIKNIEDSVNGIEVDKEKVASSKWVVNTLIALRKAVTTDEAEVTALRMSLNQADEATAEQEEEEVVPEKRFSMHCLPSKADV
jgi:vacuolar-type H+-ATPase subunit I/STV1